MTTATISESGTLLKEAFDIAQDLRLAKIEALRVDGQDFPALLTGSCLSVIDPKQLDAWRTTPRWRKGSASHTRLDSFIGHTNRFKAANSAIFANDSREHPSLTTIFDYHPEGDSRFDAQLMDHRAHYNFPLSDEWKAWFGADGKSMSMADFAAFLEDRIVDVVADAEPASPAAKDYLAKTGGNMASPSRLIQIARGLQVNESSTFREARNLSTGEAEILFEVQHQDANGAKLVLPNVFMICIPVFARSDVYYQILARFRYRKAGGSVSFWYDLWRSDLVFEQAFSEACDKVAAETGLPLFVGKPEA